MATIDSLDLATLTNNPQSIAEALEDVLETSSGNIGSLKTSAQEDHDAIEALRTSAQEDHDAIENLFNNSSASRVQYTSLLNSWTAWDNQGNTNYEHGVTVQNLGRLWIISISAYKNLGGTGSGSEKIVDISNDFTMPGGNVRCGIQHYGTSVDSDFTSLIELNTSGEIFVYYNNTLDNYHNIVGNFLGLDVS